MSLAESSFIVLFLSTSAFASLISLSEVSIVTRCSFNRFLQASRASFALVGSPSSTTALVMAPANYLSISVEIRDSPESERREANLQDRQVSMRKSSLRRR